MKNIYNKCKKYINSIVKSIAKHILKQELKELNDKLEFKENLIQEKLKIISKLKYPNPKEEYYNKKYPTSNITYRRTDKNGINNIDVRQFLNPNDFNYPIFQGTDDEIALKGLKWVQKNIKYTPDITQYKSNEYWAFGYETFKSKKGDCEDGAIILYNILRNSGIKEWKLRLSAGNVKYGNGIAGHCYLTYYCEEADKWVILDWCYWPNKLKIKDRKEYKNEKNYYNVWFSFNEKYSWSKGLNTESKRLLK